MCRESNVSGNTLDSRHSTTSSVHHRDDELNKVEELQNLLFPELVATFSFGVSAERAFVELPYRTHVMLALGTKVFIHGSLLWVGVWVCACNPSCRLCDVQHRILVRAWRPSYGSGRAFLALLSLSCLHPFKVVDFRSNVRAATALCEVCHTHSFGRQEPERMRVTITKKNQRVNLFKSTNW